MSAIQLTSRGMALATRRLSHRPSAFGGAAAVHLLPAPYQWSPATKPSRQWFSSYPPHQVVGLPSLSPTMEAGSISAWNMEEGASFIAGDVFCSVETDKATMDFEAQDDGFVARILVTAGPDEIKCGSPIMITVEDEDSVAAFKDYVVEGEAASDASASSSPPAAAEKPESTSPTPPTPSAPPAELSTSNSTSGTNGRVSASPLAHKLAKELGYDVSNIAGTGPGGRILAADVKEYTPAAASASASSPAAHAPAPAQAAMSSKSTSSAPISGEGYTDFPLSDQARELAARLQQSKRNVPHYYLTVDISCDKLLAIRSQLNSSLQDGNKNNSDDASSTISVYDLLIKAAAISMKTVPSVNASWLDSVVRVYDSVDMNIVVRNGGDALYTPVIANAASMGLKQISSQVAAAVKAAAAADEKDGVAPELQGGVGTFTIMNLGMYGIKSCAPIIREPQSCALAIGALENRIVPSDDDDLYKESVVFTATLSCDHRVVDGAVGAQWLAAFKSHVENPMTLLL